jgi:xylulokinase
VTDNRGGAVRYDEGLIAQLGVDRDKLPEVVGSTDRLGALSAEASSALGLKREVVVIAGAIDNSAVAVGAGAVRDFETHLYLGTSSWLGAHLPFKKTDLASKIAAVPCAIEGRYLATALQSAAGSNLSFFRDRILYHPDELMKDDQRPDVYQAFDRMAAAVPAGARGLLYMPWLFGERSPVEDANLRAGLVNLSLEHSRADVVRAFLEGVALNTRWMLEPFERFVGRANAAVTAVGGGAQSDLWCQILADATGRTVRQPETPLQANATGAAFIAAVGLGAITFDDVPALIRWRRDYAPDRRWRALYDERFACFREAYRRLAPLYRRLNAPMRTPT